MNIGILSLQGNAHQHAQVLQLLNISSLRIYYIRSYKDLSITYDAIILPGGESTTISRLLVRQNLFTPLQTYINNGLPVLATCAGVILLATHINTKPSQLDDEVHTLACANITVMRNYYGRQTHSFAITIPFTPHSSVDHTTNTLPQFIEGLCIRAPKIVSPPHPSEVLASYADSHTNTLEPMIIQEHHMLMATFHPEALLHTSLHRYFIDTIVMPYMRNRST